MKRLLREPVFHFALLGLVFFGWFHLTNDDPRPTLSADQIVITDQQLRQLVDQHIAVWRRPPTEQELTALAELFVTEEILIREAQALGLDRDDAIIRNRLRQKMQFLTASAAQALTPTDEELKTYIQNNPARFSQPPRLGFEHIYLGETTDDATLADIRTRLDAGDDPTTLGKRSLMPATMQSATSSQVDSTFGQGFFEALNRAETNSWIGPVPSGYGVHLVRVNGSTPAAPLEFESIRDKAVADWRQAQSELLVDAHVSALRDRYQITPATPEMIRESLGK